MPLRYKFGSTVMHAITIPYDMIHNYMYAVADPEMKKRAGHTSVGEELSARYTLCNGVLEHTPPGNFGI